MNQVQAERAARVFIAAMRREWAKRYVGKVRPRSCPIKPFEEYSADDRGALMRSIAVTVAQTNRQ